MDKRGRTQDASPSPLSVVRATGEELPGACTMPSLDVDPATGLDPVLYKGAGSPSKSRFLRKPPHLDRRREYEASKSHHAARATVAMLSDRHRELQIEKEECFEREKQKEQFRTRYIETRLATNGAPTLNTIDVRIARERTAVAAAEELARASPGKKISAKQGSQERVCQAIRLAYGSRVLDLKALELVHIPREVFSTLLLQLGRFMTQVNVSRNALREIPDTFVLAFPQVSILNYKENALDQLPHAMDKLTGLTELNAECNQLRLLPAHLPSTLQRMTLSRNRLTTVPHLHELTRLVELNVSHNHIHLLPPGMAFLSHLNKLVLSGNRLVSLALLPKFIIPTTKQESSRDDEDDDGQQAWSQERIEMEQNKWRVESDPLTGDSIFFHLDSKCVTRVKPRCFRSNVPMLAIGKTAAVVKQKRSHEQWLAIFPDGWEVTLGGICINAGSGRPTTTSALRPETSPGDLQSMEVLFTHHLTEESYTSIPPALDQWHALHRIHALHLSGNQLLELPASIGKLARLKLLDVENNRLLSLPDTFLEMPALETVRLAMNSLSWLPPSFCSLPNLTDLDLKLNRFETIPDEIVSLTRLCSLDLSSNSLVSLSQGLLSLKKLTTLRLQGNDKLVTSGLLHAETLASGDIPQIFWHLNHQILVDQQHGGQLPPQSVSHVVGVGEEVWSTNHHVHKAFAQAIQVAQQTHTLDFHWKQLGFTQFPSSFFQLLGGLRELRLSGQELAIIPTEFSRVCSSLRVLQLRKNKIHAMEDGVFGLETSPELPLEELDLEYNQLETFPVSIGKLKSLRTLSAPNNRLEYSFPETFARLISLKELNLSHNRLIQPPRELGELASLEKLDLSYNQLTTLATMAFAKLQRLVQLRVNVNQLRDLPEELAQAPIQELYIAGNQLSALPSTVLLLKNSLRVLRMQTNKISRLPVQFGELTALETVQADGNPFLSPPAEIMNMGITAIRMYLVKRQQRVEEITRLLHTIKFPFDADRFVEPRLNHLLIRDAKTSQETTSPMKFLTEKHLTSFEKAVDSYINGPFYLLPAVLRGADLVTEFLLQKQFFLAQTHRERVLRDLVKLFALIRAKKWLDKVDFRYDLQRPWGRLGEECAVYAVNPRVLYEDQPQLPSVLSVVKKRVYHGFEDEAFDHSEEDVVDAIEHYVGVYGPVGVAHDDVPFKCGCEELLRYNKQHEPCYRTGWSIVQVVYTEEEASRRVADEQTIKDALAALRPQIVTFLQTKEGEKRFHQEVKKIKTVLRKELANKKKRLKKLKAIVKKMQQQVKKERKEDEKQKNKQAPAKKGKPLQTLAEIKETQDRDEKMKRLEERLHEWTQEYDKNKSQLGQGYQSFMDDVVTVLMEKVGVEVRNHLVRQQRQRAIEFGLRRPWDGPNGRDFEEFKRLVRRKMLSDGAMEREENVKEEEKAGGGEAESDNSEISDVSFDGYEDLVSNLIGGNAAEIDGDEDEDEDEDEEEEDDPVARAEAMDKLEVSDVSEDDASDAKRDSKAPESEDSEL